MHWKNVTFVVSNVVAFLFLDSNVPISLNIKMAETLKNHNGNEN